jgi:hypothetical protein
MAKYQKNILLFLYFIILINSKKIIFPFKEKELNKTILSSNDPNMFYNQIYINNLYTKLKISNADQLVLGTFASDKTNLKLKNIKELYNIEGHNTYAYSNSKTFKNITSLTKETITKGYSLINETIKLYENNDKLVNINDFQIELYNYYNLNDENQTLSFEIGLKNDNNTISFIEQLLNKSIISSNILYINYKSNNEGYISLGEYPEGFNNAQTITKKMNNIFGGSLFQIDADFVYMKHNNGRTFYSDTSLMFYLEQGIIMASDGYEKTIKEAFFNDKIKNGLCNESQIYFNINEYNAITCSDEVSLKDFPTLNFEINDALFTLDYNDLFTKINKTNYFLVIFSPETQNWVLGKPFLKKYQTIIDSTKNTISLYNPNNNNNDEKSNENNNSGSNVFLIVLIILVVIIILAVLVFLFIKLNKNKIKSSDVDSSIKGPLMI